MGELLGKALLTGGLFQSTVNTQGFNAWVIQDLIPTLPKNSVVTMANATVHKGQNMLNAFGGCKRLHCLTFPPILQI
jgi:prophage antirepressor-like protein